MPSSQLAQQIRQQVSCESLDDEDGTGASIASLKSAGSSWEMNSWELDASEVQICLDSRNRPWKLGSGGFGSVSLYSFRLNKNLPSSPRLWRCIKIRSKMTDLAPAAFLNSMTGLSASPIFRDARQVLIGPGA